MFHLAFGQQRPRLAFVFAQPDQGLCYLFTESLDTVEYIFLHTRAQLFKTNNVVS